MSKAKIRARICAPLRSAAALLLVSSFSLAHAQAPADTRASKLARAAKEATEAIELAKKNDTASVAGAIQKLQTAEAIYAELGEKEKLMSLLFFLGHLQLVLDRKDAGVATLSKALPLAQELDKREQQIRILGRLGEYFFRDGKTGTDNKERARDYLDQAVAVIEKTDPKPDPLSYDAYELLGRIWMSLYSPTNANKAFLKAYNLEKEKPPEQSIAGAIKYAEWQVKMGYPKYAVPPLLAAGKKAYEAKLTSMEAMIAWRLGDLMAGTFRDLRNAKRSLERAEQLLAAAPDEALEAKIQLSWGKYYFATFDLTKAGQYFEKALNPRARVKPAGLYGEVLLHSGILHYTVGRYDMAVMQLTRAAEVNGAESRTLMEMESLRYLARSLNAAGRVDEAWKTMTQAVQARGESGAGWTSAESVAILIDHSDFLIEAFRSEGDKDPTRDVRISRSRNQLDLAYRTAKRERMTDYQALAGRRLASVYSLLGDNAKALELLNEALVNSRSAGLPVQEAGAMTGLMDVSLAMGNTGAASFYGKSAVNVYQGLRKKIADLSPEERVSYLRTVEKTYRKLASLLIRQGRIAEAEQVLTMLKEEELLEYVRRDDGVARRMLESVTLTEEERAGMRRYDTIAEQITALGKEYGALDDERLKFPPGEFPQQKRLEDLERQLQDARLVFEKFLEDLKLKFGQRDTRVAQADSNLKKTLRKIGSDRTAVVTTIVGVDELSIIVTTTRTQRAHVVRQSEEKINALVATLREGLKSPTLDPRPPAQELYNVLVKPIEGDLAGIRADTIIWSLDGTLRYIPPAALWDKEKGYLAERFTNAVVNLANRTSLERDPMAPGTLSVLGVGVSKSVDGFSALTAVPDELDCIVADRATGPLSTVPQCATGVLTGRKLLDERFTLSSFKGELGRYPVIHIASHFKLTPGDDKNSFLLLGGGEERRFTLDKLRGESFGDVELMVLSACDTATPAGAKVNGTEVESFSALAQQEARSVIATLWSVSDTSTRDLMVEFYRLYGKDGLSKGAALRRSQLKLMNGQYSSADAARVRGAKVFAPGSPNLQPFEPDPKAPFAHPFYWSPFVLMGNWR